MSLSVRSYAAQSATSPIAPWTFERREARPHDVVIDIKFCGVCHSDIHQARNEWSGSSYPMVPGHEIVGTVLAVGSAVTGFAVGELAGVGCMVDSCRRCAPCLAGDEQYCDKGASFTYNSTEQDRTTPTYGGYATQVVVDEKFVVHVSDKLALDAVAPLLCAGITMWSPLQHWGAKAGSKVAINGLGGLGHMGIKLGAALGAEVTVLSSGDKKRDDAKRLGAVDYVVSSDRAAMKKHAGRFDLIIDTVSADHDLNQLANLLRTDGDLVLVGVPEKPLPIKAFSLIAKRRSLSGSSIGGIRETQEMLDFCAANNLVADIETIAAEQINTAYDRMLKSDVRYRFVIDAATI